MQMLSRQCRIINWMSSRIFFKKKPWPGWAVRKLTHTGNKMPKRGGRGGGSKPTRGGQRGRGRGGTKYDMRDEDLSDDDQEGAFDDH